MPLAVLGIGGNLGNREEYMAAAIDFIENKAEVEIQALSGIYETEPYDVTSKQNKYLNCCILVKTTLSPLALLSLCHEIEQRLGRVRLEYHGSRTIDIDILLYDGVQIETDNLSIPHKCILERAFVMIPLADLFPEHRALGFDFTEEIITIDKSGVELYK